jgi:hypothetical protein
MFYIRKLLEATEHQKRFCTNIYNKFDENRQIDSAVNVERNVCVL